MIEPEVAWTPLPDVTQTRIRDLFAGDDSTLGRCVDRLVRQLDDPDGVISAFQSFITE